MNYSAIDLDINHYEHEDLERFFNLSKKYREDDIVTNEIAIRNKIMGTIADKSFQNQFFIFLDEAKRLLIQRLNINPLFRMDPILLLINHLIQS